MGRQQSAIVVLLAILIAGCILSRQSRVFRSGSFTIGMTQEEVTQLLGKPSDIVKRPLTPDDLREVWIYHVSGFSRTAPHYPTIHMVIFSNGRLVGWDVHDPYDPALARR